MAEYTTYQSEPVPEPQAHIDTSAPDTFDDDVNQLSLLRLQEWATTGGDISESLDPSELSSLGARAIREWREDAGSRNDWLDKAEHYLDLAAQETDDEEREPLWENAADIHYPILSTASGQFLARASPELIKGDKVVGVKVFTPPTMNPGPQEIAQAAPPPQNPMEAQQGAQELQQDQRKQALQGLQAQARNARAERVKHYLNFLIFYRMDDWEGDTDLLILQSSIIGGGFKKVYMGDKGLCSDFTSSTRLTVHNDTKNLQSCPRVTQEFELYPHEITQKMRAGIYREVSLVPEGMDPQAPRELIETHRLDDLDGDGMDEPYIVTIDVKTEQVLRVEPAYTADDIMVNPMTSRVIRIERWLPFAPFLFLPDPRGKFYGIGLGALLDSITATIDTSVNQLIDAGTAQIAGGGFIGSGIRMQGSGQGGSVFFQPGEYKTIGTQGADLRQAIWERTVPQPSAVTMQMLEMLLGAAKDIASVKDVITGEAPSTAPVGTTLALQNQALQVFSSIYKRIYRGFKDEFRLMYQCLRRWATDRERNEYQELTGGDFDKDFSGDGTDIEPVADPTVVTKMQKLAKFQTILQWAESPLGQAAGMTQPQAAQAITMDFLDAIDTDRPERYVGPVQPNPEAIAKAQDMSASANLKQAQAQEVAIKARKGIAESQKTDADANLARAKAIETIGNVAHTTHAMHVISDQIEREGSLQSPEPEPEGNQNG